MLDARLVAVALLSALLLSPTPVIGHDPSAYGGLFRSRDGGVTWFPANPGRIVSGAIALAVSPVEPTQLLLATDSGLLRSRNAGLDWSLEAPALLVGAVFAVAFDADGGRALASTASCRTCRRCWCRPWPSWEWPGRPSAAPRPGAAQPFARSG